MRKASIQYYMDEAGFGQLAVGMKFTLAESSRWRWVDARSKGSSACSILECAYKLKFAPGVRGPHVTRTSAAEPEPLRTTMEQLVFVYFCRDSK